MENNVENRENGLPITGSAVVYRYESKEHYLVSHYRGELEFAKTQLERQLETLTVREAEHSFDMKIFGGLFIVSILLLPLMFVLSICGVTFPGIVGALLLICNVAFQLYAFPVCVYRMLRAFVMMQMNKKTKLSLWIARKWNIPLFVLEREQCERQLKRIEMFLHDIDEYEEDVKLLEDVSFEPIRQRIDMADIHEKVGVTNPRYGRLNDVIRIPAVLLTILAYVGIGYVYFRIYMVIYKELVFLFQQI